MKVGIIVEKEFCFESTIDINDQEVADIFNDRYIEFIESNNWYCGGGYGLINDGSQISMNYGVSVEDELTYEIFCSKLITFFESQGVTYKCEIKEVIDGYYINEDGSRGSHVISEDYEENVLKEKRRKTIRKNLVIFMIAFFIGSKVLPMINKIVDKE